MPETPRPDVPPGAPTQFAAERDADGRDPSDRSGSPSGRADTDLAIPRTNPVPLVLSAIAAVTMAIILVMVFVAGGDDGNQQVSTPFDEPVVIEVGDPAPPAIVADGEPLPEATFAYLAGDTVGEATEGTFADFAGQPLVLNFFASWCAPCIQEMPELQLVSEEFADEVTFLGMATRDTPSQAEGVVERTGVTYPASLDADGSIAAQLRVIYMPSTFFVDADGKVQRVWLGPISADEVRQIIDRHLLS